MKVSKPVSSCQELWGQRVTPCHKTNTPSLNSNAAVLPASFLVSFLPFPAAELSYEKHSLDRHVTPGLAQIRWPVCDPRTEKRMLEGTLTSCLLQCTEISGWVTLADVRVISFSWIFLLSARPLRGFIPYIFIRAACLKRTQKWEPTIKWEEAGILFSFWLSWYERAFIQFMTCCGVMVRV